MLWIMRAGLSGRHAVAFAAVEGDVDLQGPGMQCAGPELIENVLRIIRTIVVADASVVAAYDKVRTAEVLANKRMQQRLPRTRITHLDRITGLDHRSGPKIIVDHGLNCPGANVGRNVARF